MTEHRFSWWHVVGILAAALGIAAAAMAGGLFVGYQWGAANGRAAALAGLPHGQVERAPRSELPFPFEPGSPFELLIGRPYLGVEFEMITKELAESEKLTASSGAVVRRVADNSPAAKAGLKVGDIIQKVGDDAVNSDHTLRDLILKHKPGDPISLQVLRDGGALTINVTLAEQPGRRSFSFPLPDGELKPGFRFEFRCSPQPCPFQPLLPDQTDPSRRRPSDQRLPVERASKPSVYALGFLFI